MLRIFLKCYPAKNGDCFLIALGENDEHKHFIIDCGFADTFNNYLKADLVEISKSGGCIDKLIITHIDSDHIQGALAFLKQNNEEHFISVKEIWHNSYRHLFANGRNELDKKGATVIRQIISRDYPSEHNEQPSAISAKQGTTLGALILKGSYLWNSDFEGQAVCSDNRREVKLDEQISIYVLSPDKEKLEKLRNFWKSEIIKYSLKWEATSSEFYDDAFEMLMAWEKQTVNQRPKQVSSTVQSIEEILQVPLVEDSTVTNGSSIAFIIQIHNKRILFLGDAHPDLIVKSLDKYQEGRVKFDLIKISHHGSLNNVSNALLDKIESNRFLFSTNGAKHGHPDRETIAHIINRSTGYRKELIFNYVTSSSEYFNQEDLKSRYNYSIHYLDKQPFSLEL